MAGHCLFPKQVGLVVFVLLLSKMTMVLCQQYDQSTHVYCSGAATFPEVGRRICYERTVSPDPFNIEECSLQAIPSSNQSIELFQNKYTIHSPRFLVESGTYQNKRLCQYHVPTCPQNTLAHLEWFQDQFILEPPLQFGSVNLCLDYVRVFNLNLDGYGVELDTLGNLCGNPSSFQEFISGTALQVEFASDTAERFRGFRMDVTCVPFGN